MIVYLSDSKEARELTTHKGASSLCISLIVVIRGSNTMVLPQQPAREKQHPLEAEKLQGKVNVHDGGLRVWCINNNYISTTLVNVHTINLLPRITLEKVPGRS